MAENFEFGLDIDVDGALSDIEKVNRRIDKLMEKSADNNDIISQKDVNNAIRRIEEIRKQYEKLNKEAKSKNDVSNSSMEDAFDASFAIEQARKMGKELDAVTAKYRKLANTARISNSPQFSSTNYQAGQPGTTNYDTIGMHGIGSATTKRRHAEKTRELQQDQRSMNHYTKQIERGGYITNKDYKMAYDLRDKVASYKGDNGLIKQTQDSIAQKASDLKMVDTDIQKLQQKQATRGGLNKDEKVQLNAQLERSRAYHDEIVIMKKYQIKLEETAQSLEAFTKTLDSATNIKADRDTIRGIAHERAPSLAMGMTGVVGGALYSQVSKGTSLKEGMLDDNLYVGNQTGNYNYFDVRKNAGVQGRGNHLSETEAIKVQNDYMNSVGFQSQDDLNASVSAVGTFARGSGLSVDKSLESTVTMGNAMNSADANSIKGMQQAFSGALKDSGMVGQADKQLTALNSVVDSIGSSRSLSGQDMGNLINMQAVLAKSKDKSMQGEAGAQLISSIDQGIVGSQGDSLATSILMSEANGKWGTGANAYYGAQAEMAKGSTGEALGMLASRVDKMATDSGLTRGTDEYNNMFRANMQNLTKTNLSNEQGAYLAKMYADGEFSKDYKMSEEQQKEYEALGKEELAKGSAGYNDSGTAKEKQYKDSLEEVASASSDVMSTFKGLAGTALVGTGALGAFAVAVGIASTALIGMGGSLALSKGIKSFTSGTATGGGGTRRKGFKGMWDSMKGNKGGGGSTFGGDPIPGGGGKGPTPGGGGASGGATGSKMAGTFDNIKDRVKGNMPGTSAMERASKGGGALGTLGETGGKLGKVAKGVPLLGAGLTAFSGYSAYQQVQSQDKANGVTGSEHNANVGEVIGDSGGALAGGAGGAMLGASIGSVVPGLGTAVGGVVGGIGGAFAGSSIGKSLGGWIGGLFGKDKSVDKKEDESTTAKKEAVEEKRSRNIKEDKAFLNAYNASVGRGGVSAGSYGASSGGTVETESEAVPDSGVSSATSTDTDSTAPTPKVSKVAGSIEVTHKGEVKGSVPNDTVKTTIDNVNKLTVTGIKATLPNGNETKLT